MILSVKNMVCVRCKMAVQAVLQELQIDYQSIELGRVKLPADLSLEQLAALDAGLKRYELELMDDKRKILAERIKVLIIELFHSPHDDFRLKLSEYLSTRLNYDYTYLSNTFSETEGSTIERFYIVTRIEKVKELIVYEDLTVTEIAYLLNYSNVSHLCLQFKKITGQTPSVFKKCCASGNFIWRTCV